MAQNKAWLKAGIIGAVIVVAVYLILVYINLTSIDYRCAPHGIARMSNLLYPPKYWLANYAQCTFTIDEAITPVFVWLIIGFVGGAAIGLKLIKNKSKNSHK
jgi:hypothetical protein